MSMKGYGRLIRCFGDLTICQLFFTDRGKVKRFYALKIPDFSSNLELIANRAKRLSLTV